MWNLNNFCQKFEDLRTSTLALVEHFSLFTYFRFFKSSQKLFILISDMFIVVVKYMKYCKWTSFQLKQPQSVGKLNHKKSLLNILPKLISYYNSELKVTNTEKTLGQFYTFHHRQAKLILKHSDNGKPQQLSPKILYFLIIF